MISAAFWAITSKALSLLGLRRAVDRFVLIPCLGRLA
jgi:hypothetical protein